MELPCRRSFLCVKWRSIEFGILFESLRLRNGKILMKNLWMNTLAISWQVTSASLQNFRILARETLFIWCVYNVCLWFIYWFSLIIRLFFLKAILQTLFHKFITSFKTIQALLNHISAQNSFLSLIPFYSILMSIFSTNGQFLLREGMRKHWA